MYNYQQPSQTAHSNYFMSPQGFVNSTTAYSNRNQHHGFSLPSNNYQLQPMIQPPASQVTMNINMNMYPNVMNINMGNCGQQPGQQTTLPYGQNHH